MFGFCVLSGYVHEVFSVLSFRTLIFSKKKLKASIVLLYHELWVTPLFKGGSQTERDNYRPISVLPCISKVYESFANNDLQRFATDNGLISDHQFAYTRYSSTTVALIIAVDSWKLAIDKGEKVVCTFLDLRKAFDVIEHATLISKLSKRGVRENELEWFKSYLQQRSQFVSCASVDSERR